MTKPLKWVIHLIIFPCAAILLLVPARLLAQTTPVVVRDPSAITLANKALQAIAGTTALTDITLQANATYIAGSDQETGSATLVALRNQQSLVTLNLTGGRRQEIRSGIAGVWEGADATPHAIASHNCFLDASWFFPAFTLAMLASDPTLSITLVGQEARNGEAVYHLALYRVLPRKRATTMTLIASLSTMHLYLDAATFLPVALAFNLHPDRETGINVPCEIRYGAYQSFGGVQVPTRIQKYLQNSLSLDLTIANAMVNSGVSASVFALPAVPTGGVQ